MTNDGGNGKSGGRRTRGRPRDPAVEEAVFRATIETLSAVGYGRATIGDISRKSGITRPTIYLRWKNIHDLVVDALDWYVRSLPPLVPQGDDLVDALMAAANMMVPEGRRDLGLGIVGHVIADARQHPDLLEIVRKRMIDPSRKALLDILSRYMEEGLMMNGVAPEVLADLMMGSFVSMFLTTGSISPSWAEQVADAVWSLLGREKRMKRSQDGGA
jgi:AcrR family transcriptional regulator